MKSNIFKWTIAIFISMIMNLILNWIAVLNDIAVPGWYISICSIFGILFSFIVYIIPNDIGNKNIRRNNRKF